jgi:hypothetical protein
MESFTRISVTISRNYAWTEFFLRYLFEICQTMETLQKKIFFIVAKRSDSENDQIIQSRSENFYVYIKAKSKFKLLLPRLFASYVISIKFQNKFNIYRSNYCPWCLFNISRSLKSFKWFIYVYKLHSASSIILSSIVWSRNKRERERMRLSHSISLTVIAFVSIIISILVHFQIYSFHFFSLVSAHFLFTSNSTFNIISDQVN